MVVDDGIAYPDSDGEPIGETDLHVDDILYMRVALKEHFRETPDVYVTSNLLLFYQKGEPEKFVVPDVMIVRGVSKEMRRNYLLWKEGVAPGLIVEVTSDQTWERDLSTRIGLYAALGVQEYFLFEPYGEHLHPQIQAYRLAGCYYQPIRPEEDASLVSLTAGVSFRVEDSRLRLVDVVTGTPLLRAEEVAAARKKAQAREATAAEARLHTEEPL